MPTKLQFDAERWLRNNADIYTRMGSPQIAQNMVLCADEIKKLRMAVDLGEQGAEEMVEELAKVKGDLAALKEAVAWEREFDEVLVWLVQTGRYPRDMAGKYDLANERECASAEVDRLLQEEK